MVNNNTGINKPAQLTGPLEGHFLKLTPEKAPVGWDTYELDALRAWPNIGVLLPEPYVAVDIDDVKQAEKLTKLIKDQGIKSQIMQTTRGRHFWFAAAEPMKNVVKSMTGIGLVADYRSWGKNSQVCVKFQGGYREWLTNYSWDEIDELPRWLRPLRQTNWKFYEMGEGDGRNQALFNYQIELSRRGYTQQEGVEVCRLINKYILKEPLSEKEIATICREEAYPETQNIQNYEELPWRTEKGRLLHNIMGDMIVSEKNVISYNQRLYVYKNGYYHHTDNDVLQKIIEMDPGVTKKEREEVMDYIRIQKHLEQFDIDEYVINVKNGRLNLKTGELMPHTPKIIDFQQVDAVYNPTAYYEALDNMLMRVFCGDYQLYKLFEEMLGYCLIKNCRMQKIFVFFGDGNNGKSTLLRMICSFIGDGNYSTLSLQDLETTFRPAELENKLANLGDDIPVTTIKDSSRLKSISSGERITVERKNKNPFILKNYATLIFTTNKMPHVNDKSFGFYRRLVMIPLDAKFSVSDPDYDPDISQKVTSNQAMSYLLNMAIRGLKRMLKKGFTTSDKVEKAVETYRIQSSNTLSWVYDNEITEEYLLSKHTGELYYEFKIWCEAEGIENIPRQQNFTIDIMKKFSLIMSPQQREQKTGRKCRFFIKSDGTTGEGTKKRKFVPSKGSDGTDGTRDGTG